MSINNSYRLASYDNLYVRNQAEQSQQKARVVSEVKHTRFTFEENSPEQTTNTSQSSSYESYFANSAQELFYTSSNTIASGAQRFRHTASFKEAKSTQLDEKRHQNYFNQIMNFERPSGNWVDVQV